MRAISSIHKHLYCFFVRRKLERSFLKSVTIVSLAAVFSMPEMVRMQSIMFQQQLDVSHLPAFFILALVFTFIAWLTLSTILYLIAGLLRYPVEFESLMLLSAYSFLTTIFSNSYVRGFFGASEGQKLFVPFSIAAYLISFVLWFYAVKVSGKGVADGMCD
jgi:hypothetical protein